MKKSSVFFFACFALVFSPKIFAQTDSWEKLPLPAYHGFTKIEADGDRIFAVANWGAGIFGSEDDGATFERLWDGRGFFIHPQSGDYFRIDYQNQLFRSIDDGANWMSEGQMPQDISHNPLLSFGGDTIYSYARDVLYRQKMDKTWEQIFYQPVSNLKNCVVRGQKIWLETDSWYVHSSDGGNSWNNVPLPCVAAKGMAATGDTLLFYFEKSDGTRALARSTDLGATFQVLDTPVQLEWISNRANPFLGRNFGGDWFRSNNGLTNWQPLWQQVGGHPSLDLILISGKSFVATLNGVLSEKAGVWQYGWHGFQDETDPSGIDIGQIGKYFLCLSNGATLAFSDDNGDTWRRAWTGELPRQVQEVGGFWVGLDENRVLRCPTASQFDWRQPVASDAVFQPRWLTRLGNDLFSMNQCCQPNLIFKSDDFGATEWETTGSLMTLTPNLPPELLLGIGTELLTRTDSELIASSNGGATWNSRYNFGFPIHTNVARIFQIGTDIFVAQVEKRKIYRSSNSGQTFVELPNVPNDGGSSFQFRVHGNAMLLNTRNITFGGPGSLYFSCDKGETWMDIGFPPALLVPNFINRLTANDSTVFFIGNFVGSFGLEDNLWRKRIPKSVSTKQPDVQLAANERLRVSPNPILDGQPLQISWENEITGDLKIEFLALDGRVLHTVFREKTTQAFVERFQVSETWPGVFAVRVLDGNNTATRLVFKF